MDIIGYDSYKQYYTDWLDSGSAPRKGAMTAVAKYLKVHPSFLSQVFKGDKELSAEQGYKLCDFIGLDGISKDYFMNLLFAERAGTEGLKKYFRRKIRDIKTQQKKIDRRMGKAQRLDEDKLAKFYSDPHISLIRLLTSIPGNNSPARLAEITGLKIDYVNRVLEFLVSADLCQKSRAGCFTMGVTRTHLPGDSTLVNNHHRNWRTKVLEYHARSHDEDLVFTAPMTLSRSDYSKLRNMLLVFIEGCAKTVDQSQAEDFAILNIDFIRPYSD